MELRVFGYSALLYKMHCTTPLITICKSSSSAEPAWPLIFPSADFTSWSWQKVEYGVGKREYASKGPDI